MERNSGVPAGTPETADCTAAWTELQNRRSWEECGRPNLGMLGKRWRVSWRGPTHRRDSSGHARVMHVSNRPDPAALSRQHCRRPAGMNPRSRTHRAERMHGEHCGRRVTSASRADPQPLPQM